MEEYVIFIVQLRKMKVNEGMCSFYGRLIQNDLPFQEVVLVCIPIRV
jgi:hypothetical protein